MPPRSKLPPTPAPSDSDANGKQKAYFKLVASAKKNRAKSIAQAHGTCLATSLDLCLYAKKLDFPVSLVMWHVKNDPDFCDHWAVQINKHQVIDMTRVQVDQKMSAEVVFEIKDYPSNFSRPSFYLTPSLLAEYESYKDGKSGKLPAPLIKNLRGLMLKQDLHNANHFRNFSGFFPAMFAYLKFRFNFWVHQLSERLQKRRRELESRQIH